MKKILLLPLAIALLASITCSCSRQGKASAQIAENSNGVYYWKTVFSPDSADFAFMKEHRIDHIYLRMFDVTVGIDSNNDRRIAVPNASVKIYDDTYELLKSDSLKAISFTPVVYVTVDALAVSSGQEGKLAENIVTRVRNMCSYNGLQNVEGLQLDCDWTKYDEEGFFKLCDSTKLQIKKEKLPWKLSSTIRLHQLDSKAPPVDYGVLMVYNTGNFRNIHTRNSILSIEDVQPYIKHLGSYPLPLDIAYPTYSWQLLFKDNIFIGLLQGLDLADTTKFKSLGNGRYESFQDFRHNDTYIGKGDVIKNEDSDIAEILQVKKAIDGALGNKRHNNIIYHFDLQNLKKYSSDEIDKIFSASSGN